MKQICNLIEGIGWEWYVDSLPKTNEARVKMMCRWLNNHTLYTRLQDNSETMGCEFVRFMF